MTLPSFIVIGPGKTGTTWLYQCLAAHPEIGLARNTKETVFFGEYYDRGLGWYENFFAGLEDKKAVGEVSNTYFFTPDAPARIKSRLPGAKLIVLLRDPLERLISYYLFQRRNGRRYRSLDEAIAQDVTMVEQNFFDVHLARYLAHFPREQMLVLLNDDVQRDPGAVLRAVYGFVGVDPAFIPPALHHRILPARMARSPGIARMSKRLASWLRRNDQHLLLLKMKQSRLLRALLMRKPSAQESAVLSPQTRAALTALYRPHMARTGDMIGRDLSAWM